ncbi:MAG: hypothetical protein G4V63_30580 [Candidatus Afipia apatlaquensis]|uniref:Uncharacterized protein n=1 Tax=Candidatus Afipia apatlaquensis TaxID=2712852 RepID=A0A7C9VJD2_9BRAD|nr:hypothetical protein [Candidatus Afipia apatlaquensis]
MSKTRAELIEQALINLGVIAEGQSIEADLVDKMDGIVDPACAELSDLDIYYVQDAGEVGPTGGDIPDSAFLSLCAYIANAACSAFNLPADTKLQALSQLAEAKLITLTRPARTRRTLRIDPAIAPIRTYYWGRS